MQRKSTTTTVAPRRRRTRQQIADAEAYAAFDASHRKRLEAYCMTDLRNWEEAKEMAADALIELWKHWSSLRSYDERALRAYVFTTARRKLLHGAPRQRREREQTGVRSVAATPDTWRDSFGLRTESLSWVLTDSLIVSSMYGSA